MPKDFDIDELSRFDGKDGRPIYISHKGRIIDVSESPLWVGGLHMDRHQAGKDLSADIEAAPHGLEVLERYPQVGTLVAKEKTEVNLPPFILAFLNKHPFFRRHLHPLTVHFPIVFTLSATFFSLLFVITGNRSFDLTALYCLIGALVFMPPAIVTGLATWWINYMALPMRPVTIKITLSFVLLPVLFVLVLWRVMSGDVLEHLSGAGLLHMVLVVAASPLVVIIAYYGGTLTFPLKKE